MTNNKLVQISFMTIVFSTSLQVLASCCKDLCVREQKPLSDTSESKPLPESAFKLLPESLFSEIHAYNLEGMRNVLEQCKQPDVRSVDSTTSYTSYYKKGMTALQLISRLEECGPDKPKFGFGIQAIRLLLEYKANIDVLSGEYLAPLHYAIENKYVHMVNLFLSHKANPMIIGAGKTTPVHYAAGIGHPGILRLVLNACNEQGINKDTVIATCTQALDTPIHLAAFKGHVDALRLLFAHCTNLKITIKPNDVGYTPLHLAIRNLFEPLNTVNVLLDNQQDPNINDLEGMTALHTLIRMQCASQNCLDTARALLKYGASNEIQDLSLKKPSDYAVGFQGAEEFLKLLTEKQPTHFTQNQPVLGVPVQPS